MTTDTSEEVFAERRLQIELRYGNPHSEFIGALRDFINPDDLAGVSPARRALMLIGEIVSQIEFANGERNMIEISVMNDEFIRLATQKLEAIHHSDYDS